MPAYSRGVDLELFRAEVQVNGLRIGLSASGARAFVQKLREFNAPVIWIASMRPICPCGEPLTLHELDACAACLRARRLAAIDAGKAVAA